MLASDDPGVYGYLDLSFDFFEAAMSFGLDLAAFKQLAINSFNFSGLDPANVNNGMAMWNKKWTKFIADAKNAACAANSPIFSAQVIRTACSRHQPLCSRTRCSPFLAEPARV